MDIAEIVLTPARGIDNCFHFLIPLIALSAILTLVFVKRAPLKRADDAEKKAEAKAWVESKKAKKSGRGSVAEGADSPVEDEKRRGSGSHGEGEAKPERDTLAHRVEQGLEETAEEEAEEGGVQAARGHEGALVESR